MHDASISCVACASSACLAARWSGCFGTLLMLAGTASNLLNKINKFRCTFGPIHVSGRVAMVFMAECGLQWVCQHLVVVRFIAMHCIC